jgi:VWFA-related protein
MPVRRTCTFVLALLAAGASAGEFALIAQTPPPATAQSPQTGAPIFRGRTTVVPIDVRVVDKNGKPITDLRAEDFTILENGVRQSVDYFATQPLTPEPSGPATKVQPTVGPQPPIAPANRRIFLVMMGRGRLQEPSKGVDATIRFVRDRLMPQDQVAVMAWDRATEFTLDKTKAVAVLERFRDRHEEIEHEISLYFTDLFGLYADAKLPAHIQALIDGVFESSGAQSRSVIAPMAQLAPALVDSRLAIDSVMNSNTMQTFRLFGGTDATMASGMFDPTLGMSFADYIVLNRQTMQDVGNLYAGIDYLRFIPGEKHLIFVTEQGFYLPRADYDRDLAAFASDARVVLDTVQTGGVASVMSTGPGGAYVTVQNGFQLRALREISDISGGQSSVSKYAEQAFDRILSSSEFSYLLGYTPIDATADGRTRDIKVQVNRKGATAAYRRAYVARPDTAAFDPRESMAATRLMAAVNYPAEIPDIKLSAKMLDLRESAGRFINVEVTLDAAGLRLAKAGDRWVAALNFAVICGDYYRKDIGQLWESKDVFVPDTRIEEVKRAGLTVTLKVPVKQPPVYVRIVAYDYGSDRVGSIVKVMK